MSRTWAVVKREFLEMIRTRAFLFGTIVGPLLILGMFGFQIFLATRAGGGERTVIVVDRGAGTLGTEIGVLLRDRYTPGQTRFRVELEPPTAASDDELRADLLARIGRGEADGFVWIPREVLAGDVVVYEGKNATSLGDMERIRGAVQTAVQQARLAEAGIDAAAVREAMRRIPFEARSHDGKAARGSTGALMGLTYVLGFVIYFVVILYGNAVLRGVLEEKRERIVEVVVSSIRADQLLVGKVLGIGAAGIFQLLIWAAVGAGVLAWGGVIAMSMGAAIPDLPRVPLGVTLIFFFFFVTGYLLYAIMYAAVGAIATSDQEAQQLQMPVIMLLVLAISMMGAVMMDPNGAAAVIGSIVPITAPVVMPMRAVVTAIPPAELAAAMVLIVSSCVALLWMTARIYRIGILATGKRPSFREVWRWVRTG